MHSVRPRTYRAGNRTIALAVILFLPLLLDNFVAAQSATADLTALEEAAERMGKSDLDSALVLNQRWLDAAILREDGVEEARATYQRGVFQQGKGDFERASELYLRGMDLAGRRDNPILWAKINNRLGTVQTDMRLFPEAVRYYRSSVAVGLQTDDPATLRDSYYNLGNVYSMLDLDSSFYYFGLVRQVAKRTPEDTDFTRKLDMAEARTHQYAGNLPRAAAGFEAALAAVSAANDTITMVTVLNNLAWPYARMGDTERAQAVLDKVFRLSQEKQLPYQRLYGLAAQILVDSVRGDWPAALTSYGNYVLLDDSLRNSGKINRLAELENSYANQQKERALEDARRENELISLRNRTQRNYVLLLGLVLLLLAGLAYVLYRRYRTVERDRAIISRQSEEKTLLMQEIHHRAKNNLSTIESLLNLQLDAIDQEDAEGALIKSRDRIQAIGLIHDQLYRSDSPGDIDAEAYLNNLLDGLSAGLPGVRVVRSIQAPALDLAYTVPLGLIVNEAVANALEHGGGDDRRGQRISVELSYRDTEATLHLRIADDGDGFRNGAESAEKNYGGLFIIRGLVNQLRGQLTMRNDNGAVLEIRLPYQESATLNVSA